MSRIMKSLRCDDICKSFDGIHAVSGVSARFPKNGIVALIGPNGAGKTTLLNILTGFVPADSGRFWLGEHDVTNLPPHRIARLGIARTFQELRLIKQVTVLDNVMVSQPRQRGEGLWGAMLRFGVAAEEARNRRKGKELLRFVELEHKANELAGELSYGEQKLLTLACCLATEAKILLLDEPVAGVHPELVGRILELLRDLRNDNHLIVFIEHDLAAVRRLANRVIVMDDGRIIADGTPAEVLERPDIMEAYVA